MSVLEHIWGKSAGADRVWSHVTGLSPSKSGNRLLMVWQAFMDESFDDEFFVLAGYVSTAEHWAKFAKEWEELLPYAALDDACDEYHFKMSSMAMSKDRLSRVQAFYRIIFRHVYLGLTVVVPSSALENVRNRSQIIEIQSGRELPILDAKDSLLHNPYLLCFRHLLRALPSARHNPTIERILPSNAKVDFIFDSRSESSIISQAWYDAYQLDLPTRSLFGSAPRFEDDKEFLPLQAADFLAWWVRRWSRDGARGPARGGPYPWGGGESDLFSLNFFISEENIMENMANYLQAVHGDALHLSDRKTGKIVSPTS